MTSMSSKGDMSKSSLDAAALHDGRALEGLDGKRASPGFGFFNCCFDAALSRLMLCLLDAAQPYVESGGDCACAEASLKKRPVFSSHLIRTQVRWHGDPARSVHSKRGLGLCGEEYAGLQCRCYENNVHMSMRSDCTTTLLPAFVASDDLSLCLAELSESQHRKN